MRFVNDNSGLKRLMNNRYSYRKGIASDFRIPTKIEESEDTKIRRDVHCIINSMAKENKSSIEIKITLTEKYPNYEEYIIKIINQYFCKLYPTNKRTEASDEEKAMKDNE